ncbi:MAG: SIMPL domain-containing protein [Candidatus Pacearchaeota archaeon]|nr:SIMPL domain-containing protein [Candidatus Pacearchaeota archaeon]
MQEQRIKTILWAALVVGVLSFSYAALSYASSFARSAQPSSFQVSGEGKVVAVPDVAQVTFSVLTEGGLDVLKLQQENAEFMNQAIAFLKEQGIAEKDIKTQNYYISPRYQYCIGDSGICPPAQIVGYSVTQSSQVKIRDFTKIPGVLSGVVERGANAVSGLSFVIDDATELQNEARTEAIGQAQEKARAIASAGGFRIGRLISVTESGGSTPPIYTAERAYGGFGGASPALEPGSQDVIVSVMLQYEIR